MPSNAVAQKSSEAKRNASPEMQWCNRDGTRLVMQGLASIVRVAQGSELKLALEAGVWLVEYGENLIREQKAEKAKKTVLSEKPGREQIIRELRGLYAKALGDSALVLEARVEAPETASGELDPDSRD